MLEKMTKGRTEQPLRIVVGGGPGVGKTTFASRAPGALICDFERGSGQLDCARVDVSKTADVTELIDDLAKDRAATFQTLVIDSIDWLQNVIFEEIKIERRVASLAEDFGKGYPPAVTKFAKLLTEDLERIRQAGMHVILIAHMSPMQVNDNPALESHDRHSLKLYNGSKANPGGTSALIREWADYILFAAHDTVVKEIGDRGRKRTMARSSGDRVMFTQGTDTFEAKSRRPMLARLPLDWDAFWEAHINAPNWKPVPKA